MSVSTADCKQAIVDFLLGNPDEVHRIFMEGFEPPAPSRPALKTSNWKRESKSKPDEFSLVPKGTTTIREFDCRPYEDQLRATVYDNGVEILKVVVGTE